MPAELRLTCKTFAGVVATAVLLAGCGSKVDGTYSGSAESFFERLTLKSGGKADVTFMGMTKEGEYTVDGKQVKITVGGENQLFTVDDKGCLDGGGIIGRYCKGGSSGTASASPNATPSGAGLGGPSGIYQATDGQDSVRLEFQSAGKVRVTVSGESQPADGTYAVAGDRITVAVPGGMPMTLVNQGDSLLGSLGGQTVRFTKQ